MFSSQEPTSPSDHFVTPEKQKMVEDALQNKDKAVHSDYGKGQGPPSPTSEFNYNSPLRRAKKYQKGLRNLLGGITFFFICLINLFFLNCCHRFWVASLSSGDRCSLFFCISLFYWLMLKPICWCD